MKKIKVALLIVLLVATILISCTRAEVADDVTPDGLELIMTWSLNSVYRVYDREEGNVCYIYIGFEKGGISCVGLKE